MAWHVPPDMGTSTAEDDDQCSGHGDVCQDHQAERGREEILVIDVSRERVV